MNSNLKVKDRTTSEQGELYQCMSNGLVRVLMDTGEVRDYRPRDLIGTIESEALDWRTEAGRQIRQRDVLDDSTHSSIL